jgi:hypothetical protein
MTDEQLDLKFRYAWDWFSYHARQRLMAFNFFLILMGAVVVGYTQAVDDDLPGLGACLGFLGAFVAVAFLAMDVRNEELVRCGRAALDDMEKKLGLSIRADDHARAHLAKAMGVPEESRILRRVAPSVFKHRTLLRAVIGVMGLLSVLAGSWAAAGFPG